MSLIQYRILKALCNVTVSVRHISLQSCKFARGTRFTPPDFAVNSALSNKDTVTNNKNITSSDEHEIITLDKSEVIIQESFVIKKRDHTEHPERVQEPALPYYQKLGNSDTRFRYYIIT